MVISLSYNQINWKQIIRIVRQESSLSTEDANNFYYVITYVNPSSSD